MIFLNKMQQGLDQKVTYSEVASVKVAMEFRSKGYKIADNDGREVNEPDKNVMGILNPREPIKRRFLFFKWNKEQRALYEGRLWFNNDSIGAEPTKSWVLEIYGRENVPRLTEIVKGLSESSQVNLSIELSSENSKLEQYPFNYPY